MKKQWKIAMGITLAVLLAVGLWLALRPAERSRGVLYRVRNGNATVYLLGSIHIGSPDMYPFDEALASAMAEADTFVFECDTDDSEAAARMQQRMLLTDGETLPTRLGDERYAKLAEACEKLGFPRNAFDSLQPWAVVSTLSVYSTADQMGMKDGAAASDYGVEEYVRKYAREHGKPFAYLETVDGQIDVLAGFSDALQFHLLESECDAILQPNASPDQSAAQWPFWWKEGNASAFAEQYMSTYLEPGYEDVCREYHAALIDGRNPGMAVQIETMLQGDGTWFVTVGLMHLVLPEGSVVSLLEQKGYQVDMISDTKGNAYER